MYYIHLMSVWVSDIDTGGREEAMVMMRMLT